MRSPLASAILLILAATYYAQDTPVTAESIQDALSNINVDQAIDSLGLGGTIDNVAVVVTDDNEWDGEFAEEWDLNEETSLDVAVDTNAVADAINQAADAVRNDPQGIVDSVTAAVTNTDNTLTAAVAEVANTAGVTQEDVNNIVEQNQAAIDNVVNSITNAASQATLEGQNTDQIVQTATDALANLGVDVNTQG